MTDDTPIHISSPFMLHLVRALQAGMAFLDAARALIGLVRLAKGQRSLP